MIHRRKDGFDDGVGLPKNLTIPEAKNAKAA